VRVGAAVGMAMEPAETVTRVVMYFVVGAAGDGDEEADEDPDEDEEEEEAWAVVGCVVEFFSVGLFNCTGYEWEERTYRSRGG